MTPVQIKLSSPEQLSIQWDDGHAGVTSLKTLRDRCPCAGCRGETILLKTYKPAPVALQPGMYTLIGIEQVGHYAIQVSWKDGHATGLYAWEYLRGLCECGECRARLQLQGL